MEKEDQAQEDAMPNDSLSKEAFLDNMMKSIGDFDLSKIPKAYRKMTMNPLGAAAVNAAAIGIPAYFLATPIAKGLTKAKGRFTGMSPEQMQQEMALVEENAPKNRWALAGVLAALAGGFTLSQTYTPKSVSSRDGGLKSWLTWNPRGDKPGMTKEQSLKKQAFGMSGPGYKNPLHDHPGIPVSNSLDLIWEDKYLNGKEKINASLPFGHAAPNGTGLVTTGDLTQGAIRAGFGLGAGYIAGKALGTIFAAPPAVKQTLSATGALAGMLKNTGVF
jgi:hypothetical protein